jgi:hypothetical protein
MSILDDIYNNLKNINKVGIFDLKDEELNQLIKVLKVEALYLQYYIKTKYTNKLIIKENRKIIKYYITILETNINQEKINKFPEIYYLILAYLRMIYNDNKILIKEETNFISLHKYTLKKKQSFNNSLNMINIVFEIVNSFKKHFNKKIITKSAEFEYIKDLIKTLLDEYNELIYNDVFL